MFAAFKPYFLLLRRQAFIAMAVHAYMARGYSMSEALALVKHDVEHIIKLESICDTQGGVQ